MTQLATAINTKLENIGVVYLDDRDTHHPNRWRVYPFKWVGQTPMLFINQSWVDCSAGAGGSDKFAATLQKKGFAYTHYGVLHLNPELTGDGYTAWWATAWQNRNGSNYMPNVYREGRACAVLGLTWPLDGQDIKAAYRQKAKELHPDVGGDAELFQELQGAYELLRGLQL
jgi:hypothetical protein